MPHFYPAVNAFTAALTRIYAPGRPLRALRLREPAEACRFPASSSLEPAPAPPEYAPYRSRSLRRSPRAPGFRARARARAPSVRPR